MTAGCPPTSPLPPLPSPRASTRALLGYTPSTPPQLCHVPLTALERLWPRVLLFWATSRSPSHPV